MKWSEAAGDTISASENNPFPEPDKASPPKTIGTLSEKALHASLKDLYEPDKAKQEIPIYGFVADIVNEAGITEIQTQGLGKMRKKLTCFLSHMPVTLVHPIPRHKWLCWIDPETGAATKRRKSPLVGTPYRAFYELYQIKPLLKNQNLTVHLILIDVEEYRWLDGWSRDKKRGSTRMERLPLSYGETVSLSCPGDYQKLIPPSLPSPFTSKDYAKATGLALRYSQTALNVLAHVGAVRKTGKQGRLNLYEYGAV